MEDAEEASNRDRRVEEGRRLLQEKLKKKSKGKKKKSTNPGDVSTNSNASILDASTLSVPPDKGPSKEEGQGRSQWVENGPSQLTNSTPDPHYSLENDLPSYSNDRAESLDPPQDPAMAFIDNWDLPTTTTTQPHPPPNGPHPLHQNHHHGATTENHLGRSAAPPEPSSSATPSSGLTDEERQEYQRDISRLNGDLAALRGEHERQLRSLSEGRSEVVERARREVSAGYDLKLAGLQQALVEKERHVQGVEQQLLEAKRELSEESERREREQAEREERYARELSEHERMHAEMLSEREKRHAEELARLTSAGGGGEGGEVRPQDFTPATHMDSDELEAERLKLMKDKLRELHQAEKQSLIAEHEAEKQRLGAEFQQKFEDYRNRAVSDANAQVKSMYDQFVTAHKALEEKKDSLERTVSDLNAQLASVREDAERARQERESVEEEVQQLRESHSAEMELQRRNSVALEVRLKDWREKAATLEAELSQSGGVGEGGEGDEVDGGSGSQGGVGEVRAERDEAVARMSAEYEERLRSLQSALEESRARLREVQASAEEERARRERDEEAASRASAEREERLMSLERQLEESQARLQQSQTSVETAVREAREETTTRLTSEFEHRLSASQSQHQDTQTCLLEEAATNHQLELDSLRTRLQRETAEQLREAAASHERRLAEVVSEYEERLAEEQSAHVSQADLLEASVSDADCSRSSLEVAERRMKSLEDKLKAYRTQESSFEVRLAELNRQHAEDLAVLRAQLEGERASQVEKVKEQFANRMAALEKERAGQTRDLQHLLAVLNGESEAMPPQEEGEGSLSPSRYAQEIARLAAMRQGLVEAGQREAELRQQLEAEEARARANADRLRAEHQAREAELQHLLSQADAQAEAALEERAGPLRAELAELEREKRAWQSSERDLMSHLELSHRQRQELEETVRRLEAERKQLSEDSDRFQKEAKKYQVAESISKSAEEQSRLDLEKSHQALQQAQQALSELQTDRERLETENGQLREEWEGRGAETQTLLDQLGAKNKTVADLQAENDSLTSSVGTLQRKQRETEEACERLTRQLESSWGVNEELGALKDQVAELLPYREGYANMQQKVEYLEGMVRGKDESLVSAQADLEAATRTSSRTEEELANASRELERLREEMVRLKKLEGVVKAQVSPLEEGEEEGDISDGSALNRLIAGMQERIEEAEARCEASEAETSGLKTAVGELDTELAAYRSRGEEEARRLARSERELEALRSELALSQGRNEEYAKNLAKSNRQVEELGAQLTTSERKVEEYMEKLAESDREIKELCSRLAAPPQTNEAPPPSPPPSEEAEEMDRVVSELHARLASVEAELAREAQAARHHDRTARDLEARLARAQAESAELRNELDLLQSQSSQHSSHHPRTDPDSSNSSTLSGSSELGDVSRRYEELQSAFEGMKREKAELQAEVNDLRVSSTSASSVDALEAKVREQEGTIAELREKLAHATSGAGNRRPFQSDPGFSRTPLEATLTRARQILIEKLQEKGAIEKELGLRRATLECQKAEKQHLEDLLYEKKRFEQELQNQKALLKSELADLEAKLGAGGGGGGGVGGGKVKAASQSMATVMVN